MNTNTAPTEPIKKKANSETILYFLMGLAGVVLWWLIYSRLAGLSQWLTYNLLSIQQGSHLGDSIEFFIYDTPKVMMLLFLVVFGVGIIRSFFTPEKTRAFLSGKSEFAGNILAAFLGIVTPFCSCSAVPPWSMKLPWAFYMGCWAGKSPLFIWEPVFLSPYQPGGSSVG